MTQQLPPAHRARPCVSSQTCTCTAVGGTFPCARQAQCPQPQWTSCTATIGEEESCTGVCRVPTSGHSITCVAQQGGWRTLHPVLHKRTHPHRIYPNKHTTCDSACAQLLQAPHTCASHTTKVTLLLLSIIHPAVGRRGRSSRPHTHTHMIYAVDGLPHVSHNAVSRQGHHVVIHSCTLAVQPTMTGQRDSPKAHHQQRQSSAQPCEAVRLLLPLLGLCAATNRAPGRMFDFWGHCASQWAE